VCSIETQVESILNTLFLWLLDLHFSQTSNSRTHSHGRCGRKSVGTSSNGLAATLAIPDSGARALDGVLTAKGATVGRVLRNLNLTKELTKCGTVSGSVLSCDTDLLSTLSHIELVRLAVKGGKRGEYVSHKSMAEAVDGDDKIKGLGVSRVATKEQMNAVGSTRQTHREVIATIGKKNHSES
jgi:hypothetical protein